LVETGNKLFGKYDYNVRIDDLSMQRILSLKQVEVPHSFARHANKQFAKSSANVVERFANKLMRGGTGKKVGGRIIRTHGRLQGKKLKVLKAIEEAFDELFAKTKTNPLQLLIKALENAAPREDTTRVQFGGISYQVAVDVSAQRRMDLALRNLALASLTSAFNNRVTLAKAVANEILMAANADANSFAVRRKNEIERMARSAR
jgi:small subunit ribosomal protein S7